MRLRSNVGGALAFLPQDRFQLDNGFQVTRPAGCPLHVNQVLEFEAAALDSEDLDRDSMGQKIFKVSAARYLVGKGGRETGGVVLGPPVNDVDILRQAGRSVSRCRHPSYQYELDTGFG